MIPCRTLVFIAPIDLVAQVCPFVDMYASAWLMHTASDIVPYSGCGSLRFQQGRVKVRDRLQGPSPDRFLVFRTKKGQYWAFDLKIDPMSLKIYWLCTNQINTWHSASAKVQALLATKSNADGRTGYFCYLSYVDFLTVLIDASFSSSLGYVVHDALTASTNSTTWFAFTPGVKIANKQLY